MKLQLHFIGRTVGEPLEHPDICLPKIANDAARALKGMGLTGQVNFSGGTLGSWAPIMLGELEIPDEVGEDTPQVVTPAPIADPSAFTIAQLTVFVSQITSVGALQALRDAEEAGQGRVGAVKAISARIDQLVPGSGE